MRGCTHHQVHGGYYGEFHWGVAKGCPAQECSIKRDSAVSFICGSAIAPGSAVAIGADRFLGNEPHDGQNLGA